MFSLKPRSFVQSFFDTQAPRLPHMFLSFSLLFILRCRFFRIFFVPLAFSLCTESTSYDFSFRMVLILKKNLNASRPSEHPPVRGKISKKLVGGGILGCKCKTSSWHLNWFPDGGNIGCLGETHRHAGTPDKKQNKTFQYII